MAIILEDTPCRNGPECDIFAAVVKKVDDNRHNTRGDIRLQTRDHSMSDQVHM
ncbi:hypothetical protein GQ42DRAFT_165936, partial [Ramicandelaber brevisporus]